MSQIKEDTRNAAYNGPLVSLKQHHHNCIRFFKFTITAIVVISVAALVLWLAVRPAKLKFYVVTADLKQFDLTNGSTTLNYNLSLDMALRNPNKKVDIYYDRLEAITSYEGKRFGWANLPPFFQGHKNNSNLRANFLGKQVMVLGSSVINKFNQEKNNGVFSIEVKLYTRIRFKIGSLKTKHMKPDVECHLKIPLTSNGALARVFQSSRCEIDW